MSIKGRIFGTVVGAAGLAAVKTLAESGRDVDCFEQTDRVGGHWNTDYDALHLITSRDVTGYEGFPMPADYPLFPSATRCWPTSTRTPTTSRWSCTGTAWRRSTAIPPAAAGQPSTRT